MKGKVTTGLLNVRNLPSLKGKVVGRLKKNEIVQIQGERNRWFEIRKNGIPAFLSADYIEIMEDESVLKGQVTAGALNVRDHPGKQGQIIGQLYKKNQIDVIEDLGDWLEISFNEMSAYIHNDYVRLVEIKGSRSGVVNTQSLNVREEPILTSGIVGKLSLNNRVTVRGEIGSWLLIDFNQSTAYVHGEYIDFSHGETESKFGSVVNDLIEKRTQLDDLKPNSSLGVKGSFKQQKIASVWNKYGGLIEELGGVHGVDPAGVISIICVESSGKGFEVKNDNKLIIRFENHLFWKYWGKNNSQKFYEHFKYGRKEKGKTKIWQGHYWRTTRNDSWETFHGNQQKEWQVLEFARKLDNDSALKSISMGAPQIMGFNHEKIGYKTVEEMFDKFNEDIRYHFIGLFDFFSKPMIKAIQNKDFETFAKYYNGTGQMKKYGQWIQEYHDTFKKMI